MELKNPELNDIVFIKQDLKEEANECHPAYGLAYRGDAVIVKEIKDDKYFYVSHPEVTHDVTFRVIRSEIMLQDPLITVHEQREYLARTKYKTLDQRFGKSGKK